MSAPGKNQSANSDGRDTPCGASRTAFGKSREPFKKGRGLAVSRQPGLHIAIT
jgi:hypothetical protein